MKFDVEDKVEFLDEDGRSISSGGRLFDWDTDGPGIVHGNVVLGDRSFGIVLDVDVDPDKSHPYLVSYTSETNSEVRLRFKGNNLSYIGGNDKKCVCGSPSCMVLTESRREIINKVEQYKSIKAKMQKLTTTLKRVLSPSLQAQYKAGLRNGELALTECGKNELLEILAQKHEKELTEIAKEMIAEEEKKSDN